MQDPSEDSSDRHFDSHIAPSYELSGVWPPLPSGPSHYSALQLNSRCLVADVLFVGMPQLVPQVMEINRCPADVVTAIRECTTMIRELNPTRDGDGSITGNHVMIH
ncbi:hypothetical protein PIB30_046519 [Stylosanthes scabra]|uniref:Uncharacterized protein n=1 Tax=Stylosanthes scabra TaxID=79078 RepID=A0ABU6ZF86_9FABA|nr:hypothetical protein [Stylosanthes scabra]